MAVGSSPHGQRATSRSDKEAEASTHPQTKRDPAKFSRRTMTTSGGRRVERRWGPGEGQEAAVGRGPQDQLRRLALLPLMPFSQALDQPLGEPTRR